MDTLIMPRLLLIAGTGRNSGKTTLACQTIEKFSRLYSIVAIKISPHFHEKISDGEIIIDTNNLYITSESNHLKSKDSSKMLAAGARKSFFVMTDTENTIKAFNEILAQITDKDFIVCESGGLRNFVKPGLFLMMQGINQDDSKPDFEKMKNISDCLITFDGQKTDFDIDSIMISDNRWKLKDLIL